MQRFILRPSSKNQVTIPKPVRQVLGIGPGDRLMFEVTEDKKVYVRAVPLLSVRELKGIVPKIDRPMSDDFDAEIEEAMQELVEREPTATIA
jgi:AbrB family looped-hinge helix DNA binding protein